MKKQRPIVIRINHPGPAPGQINRYRNFEGFVNQFYRLHTPAGFRWMLKSNIKKLVFILIIALLLLLWYLGEL